MKEGRAKRGRQNVKDKNREKERRKTEIMWKREDTMKKGCYEERKRRGRMKEEKQKEWKRENRKNEREKIERKMEERLKEGRQGERRVIMREDCVKEEENERMKENRIGGKLDWNIEDSEKWKIER